MLSGRERRSWEPQISSPGPRGLLGVFEGVLQQQWGPQFCVSPGAAPWAQAPSCTSQERREPRASVVCITLKILQFSGNKKSFPLEICWFVLFWQHKGKAGQESKRAWFQNFYSLCSFCFMLPRGTLGC